MATQSSGTFTGTGNSTPVTLPQGFFNVLFSGGVGTLNLQYSPDGTTYYTVSQDAAGTGATYIINGNAVAFVGQNVESGFLWRVNCSAYTSGTLIYRLGYQG